MTKRLFRLVTIGTVCMIAIAPRSAAQIKIIRPESVLIPAYITFADPRISALDAFFQKHKCPYKDSAWYLHVADGNSLDYRLLPAISVIEEECGKHNPANNLFGYYGNGPYGLHPFKTIAEGVDYVGYQLSQNPLYKDKTIKQKLKIYNSVNPNYYNIVSGLMDQISK